MKTSFIKIFLFMYIIFICLSNNAGKVFYGKAVPVVQETVRTGSDASYYGTVRHIAVRGSLIRPNIIDIEGRIVIPGTIVVQQGIQYWKAIVDADKAALLADTQDVKTARINYDRYRELVKSKAESIENYQNFENEYYSYLGQYIQDKGSLLLSQEVLESRTFYAPFEGYVNNVLYTLGRASNDPPTVEISQLNPIGIKVKMPRDTANKINAKTPVTIYLPETNEPYGIYNGYSILTNDGIIFLTENHPKLLSPETYKDVKLHVDNLYWVDHFYVDNPNDHTLCVPEKSINKEGKRYFVWRAINRKFLQPGITFNPKFKVEKVYIVPGNMQRAYLGNINVQSLKVPGNLKFGDVIIYPPKKELKNEDTVIFDQNRYVIMPGETIKVEIEI